MFKLYPINPKCHFACYCTKAVNKTQKYSQTIFLPKTKLPLRLDGQKLVERDKNIYKLGGFQELFKWQKQYLSEPEFILHDGPPYANGKPHMGHAINKILKDIILRYKILNGQKVDYVPGWDCHGLPIELKALVANKDQDPVQIRTKARTFADKSLQQQMETFKSWGVIGEWENRYETKHVNYVENQFRKFWELYQKGYVYRDIKPIYWSPSSRTALAEAELEYNENHTSSSIYVRLLLKDIPNVPSLVGKRVYAVIWTTTPWTLPSNQAICYNNSLTYCLLKKPDPDDKDLYVIAVDLFEAFCKETGTEYQLLGVHSGDMLDKATYFHPIYKEKVCQFLHSAHATNTKGTGLVHTAPAHGPDDFLVGIRNNMSILDLVNDDGLYKEEAGEMLRNKYVLAEGNETVMECLADNLLHRGEIRHSYPYDWRTKKPVIIKASKQWFIDTAKVKQRATEILENVKFIPQDKSDIYKNALISHVQRRPYWCISRQRKWGVPIPVFYKSDTNLPVINEKTINHICSRLKQDGTDFWWKLSEQDLLPADYAKNIQDFTKGEDILDIWFDSGISWSYALKGEQVADIYLEGVDQFNGWFQSSLITSVALRDKAPYKTIFVHGFAVDKNGIKMSKSLGNVVDPEEVVCGKKGKKVYGIDTLRWWVACHANQASLASVSDTILDQSKEEVQKIRSVLRFAISTLSDYVYQESDFENASFTDRYILHLLLQCYRKAQTHIDNYDFHKINTLLAPLLANQISALYFTSIKDRLYCDTDDSYARRSAQYTLLQLYYGLSNIVGGIVPHLIEETYMHLPQRTDESNFFSSQRLVMKDFWESSDIEKAMDLILQIRKDINKMLGAGESCSFNVEVECSRESFDCLELLKEKVPDLQRDIKDILQVSSINVKLGTFEDEKYRIVTTKSDKFGCPRCRLVLSNVENGLCPRCEKIVQELNVASEKAAA